VKVVGLGAAVGGDGSGLSVGVVGLVGVAADARTDHLQIVIGVRPKDTAAIVAHFDIVGAIGRRGPGDLRSQTATAVVVDVDQGGGVGAVQLKHGVAGAPQVKGLNGVRHAGRG